MKLQKWLCITICCLGFAVAGTALAEPAVTIDSVVITGHTVTGYWSVNGMPGDSIWNYGWIDSAFWDYSTINNSLTITSVPFGNHVFHVMVTNGTDTCRADHDFEIVRKPAPVIVLLLPSNGDSVEVPNFKFLVKDTTNTWVKYYFCLNKNFSPVDGCSVDDYPEFVDSILGTDTLRFKPLVNLDSGFYGCRLKWQRPDYAGWTIEWYFWVIKVPLFVQDQNSTKPLEFSLSQNFPNPFNPNTNIKFALPKTGPVQLVIYNILGQPVKTLINGQLSAGEHCVPWDARDENGIQVASGIYLYKISADGLVETKKMLLQK